MPRGRALWISAIVTFAVILIVGSVFMRPMLSQSAGNPTHSNATLVTSDPAQQVTSGEPTSLAYPNEHENQHGHDDDHGNHHEEHDDGD